MKKSPRSPESPREAPARYSGLEEFVSQHRGERVIKKVLVANNGMAATKGIMSIRKWCYENFREARIIKFVVMASPEDVAVNVEYIKMADECIEVPGGPNRNNYANVDLIIDLAKRNNCDAVWVGWGHASENPAIPDALAKTDIVFLGPPAKAMRALGDKISSTVVAQTAGVPCIKWSGSGVTLPEGVIDVPDDLFLKCCVSTAAECKEAAKRVGYPLMIKASEGGGGKGIRMVKEESALESAYEQCCNEIPGSPIFLMQLATGCRHLEVQLLADNHGDCVALKTRDCSVQRRHQKIIEEGPVLNVAPETLTHMEKAAVVLARQVGYSGVGTVEYLYNKETGQYCFLELNPRLQVEHPVTEMITNVNIPAAQIMVGMGLKLTEIPDIREVFGQERDSHEPFDLYTTEQMEPVCHTIAVRVTAENPDEEFRPTSGKIDTVSFKPSKTTWAYFSTSSNGGVHEFADSQFGHIFSSGETREVARKGMVMALRDLIIKGEIRTTYEYVMNLLERPEFVNCDVSTSWLDGLLQSKVRIDQPNPLLSVLCGAIHKFHDRMEKNRTQYISFLSAGHFPSSEILTTCFSEALILNNVKYEIKSYKLSNSRWMFTMNGDNVEADVRILNDRGVLVYLGQSTHLTYAENDPNGLRVVVDGKTATFTNDEDPCSLRTTVPGKLVKFLVRSGDFIQAGDAYAEIEVMKMILQLKTQLSGTITTQAVAGTAVPAGKVLASIEPVDTSQIVRSELYAEGWASLCPSELSLDDKAKVQKALNGLYYLLLGYSYPSIHADQHINSLLEVLTTVNISWTTVQCPWGAEISADEDKDVLSRFTYFCNIMMQKFCAVEHFFETEDGVEAVVSELCAQHKSDLTVVHEILTQRNAPRKRPLMKNILLCAQKLGILKDIKVNLQKIAALDNHSTNDIVVLEARSLISHMNLPPYEEIEAELAERLQGASVEEILPNLNYTIQMFKELICNANEDVKRKAFELYIRRSFDSFNMQQDLEIVAKDGLCRGTWKHTLAPGKQQLGAMYAFDSVEDTLANFESQILEYCAQRKDSDDMVVEVLVLDATANAKELDPRLCDLVKKNKTQLLQETAIRRFDFAFPGGLYYIFRRACDFAEDPFYRHVPPVQSWHMELHRLANFNITVYPCFVNPQARVYFAEEKPGLRSAPVAPRDQDRRFFIRMLSCAAPGAISGQLDSTDAERLLVEATQLLEVALADKKYHPQSNHLFINFLDRKLALSSVEQFFVEAGPKYLLRLHALNLMEMEVKFLSLDGKYVRLFVRNPSGFAPITEMFWEEQTTHGTVMRRVGGVSPRSTMLVHANAPYALLAAKDRKRIAAANLNTTYVYDWPVVFETCVQDLWKAALESRVDVDELSECAPQMAVEAMEYVLEKDGSWIEKPVSDGKNTVGMVCWLVTMYLPSRFADGKVRAKSCVVVANDITFMSGSFAIAEDEVFARACKMALAKRLPLVYLAANSGARIGMADEVKEVYKILFNDPECPDKGYQYLYLEEEDYKTLSAQNSVNAVKTTHPVTGANIYRIKDVIGVKDGLGVENLAGSGLIAGQMSKCFDEIPTISMSTGRSVGIGAYLNRLGRRIVQTKNSPMILTGYNALNKLLGKDVYTSNNQLGGTGVMSPNGVTYWEAQNDLKGVAAILAWLDMIPDAFPLGPKDVVPVPKPHLLSIADDWDRDIEFMPKEGEIVDPRLLINGGYMDGTYQLGLFDQDTWQESLSRWATTVVVGRAKLGGIPVGVVAVETRTQENINPADPADTASTAILRTQAGNVWFPDSARKTADSIKDFQKEGLPCFIMANWRGFSGGMRDMYDEILKFGASIVDNLREYEHPVFVYLPPFGDLRGGAWVVIDPNINTDCIEMYADELSQGGVLEPSGLIEVKYRDSDIVKTMKRLDPECAAMAAKLKADGAGKEEKASVEKQLKAREEALFPIYKNAATYFAALHDTPGRMLAKKTINGIVDWKNARRFFYKRLMRKLHEFHVHRQIHVVDGQKTFAARRDLMERWSGDSWKDDEAFVTWCETSKTTIDGHLQALAQESETEKLKALLGNKNLGPSVLLTALKEHLKVAPSDQVAELKKGLASL